ncbi:FliM/FliN family flagellar motor switch protein [Sandaracinobacter neustonicus]|uniref:FliM/FliN family flagellar motor switch protein n=1 Tax=Sandaracinobacter neustonicus TaxID=1715348 RepID=A0A501XHQ7_9SPHN|nr:FliM/FliN family flagellar motor C-terminal domain-containing protein [Sandaracinobacter neustonicus]TPE60142.1 FliM/FliN family flagellar motor switch protein [Sandaracinobacter neustonicus]
MARAIVWPSIGDPAPEAAPALMEALDAPALAAAFGPELARLMGARITARVSNTPSASPLLHLSSIALSAPVELSAIGLGCPADSAARLLERLFGTRAADGARPAGVEALPPGSASWAVLCHTLAQALARALPAANASAAAPARHTDRPRALNPEPAFLLELDVEGMACTLAVVLEGARPAPPPPDAPDAAEWRQRARARALDLELPVALRIAERRIGLAQLAALQPGDILPLERPETVDVLAAGRRIARLPAAQLLPPEGPEE